MSSWNRTVKPSADTTKVATDVLGADINEVKATPGIAGPGWVHTRTIGANRRVFETLVAMKTPPVEVDADDTIIPEVQIVTQPAAVSVVAGANAVFTVAAAVIPSGAIASYQWQVSTGGAYTNLVASASVLTPTTDTLTIVSVIGDDAKRYRCVVTGPAGAGAATSKGALLTVTAS